MQNRHPSDLIERIKKALYSAENDKFTYEQVKGWAEQNNSPFFIAVAEMEKLETQAVAVLYEVRKYDMEEANRTDFGNQVSSADQRDHAPTSSAQISDAELDELIIISTEKKGNPKTRAWLGMLAKEVKRLRATVRQNLVDTCNAVGLDPNEILISEEKEKKIRQDIKGEICGGKIKKLTFGINPKGICEKCSDEKIGTMGRLSEICSNVFELPKRESQPDDCKAAFKEYQPLEPASNITLAAHINMERLAFMAGWNARESAQRIDISEIESALSVYGEAQFQLGWGKGSEDRSSCIEGEDKDIDAAYDEVLRLIRRYTEATQPVELTDYLISIWPLKEDFNDPCSKARFSKYVADISTLLKQEVDHPVHISEEARKDFENFVSRGGDVDWQRYLERDANGDYELGVARGAWAAWRGAIRLYSLKRESSDVERIKHLLTRAIGIIERAKVDSLDIIGKTVVLREAHEALSKIEGDK